MIYIEPNINRTVIENVLRKSLKHRIILTTKEIKKLYKDFQLAAIKNNNKIVGCFLSKENEIHVAILPSEHKRWFTKKLFKQAVKDLIEKYGYVKTTMMPDNTQGLKFITQLGFTKKGDWYVYESNKFLS